MHFIESAYCKAVESHGCWYVRTGRSMVYWSPALSGRLVRPPRSGSQGRLPKRGTASTTLDARSKRQQLPLTTEL